MSEKPAEAKAAKGDEAVTHLVPAGDKQTIEDTSDFPDPDEDDLDDLDDLLDDFSAVKLDQRVEVEVASIGKQAEPPIPVTAAGAGATETPPDLADILDDDDFAKQLQAGMADLLGDLEKSPEMQAEFENIFKQVAAGAAEREGVPVPASGAPKTTEEVNFQETIRKTLERMQTSGDQATAAASAEGTDDLMAEMLKQMGAGGLDGEGGEEEFSKMLMGMMEQLTTKEVLYEPMRELNEKFPDWMAKNRDKTSKEDLKRYDEQQTLAKQIVEKYEAPGYSDTNQQSRAQILDLMQKMQAAGSPPAELVGDMASAQEALGDLGDLGVPEESCNPQ